VTGVPYPGHGTHRSNLLVGRATERAAIDALLGDAERGVAGALLFTGPAGIGKSALVQYAIDGGSGFRVVRIVGVESEMVFGYAAVHQLGSWCCCYSTASRDCPNPNEAHSTACSARRGTMPSIHSSSASRS
jgi:hypothetical protein